MHEDNEIQLLGQKVAKELKEFRASWDPEYGGHVVYLEHSDGRKLSIRQMWNHKDRAEVHGIYPPNELTQYDRGTFHAEITVSIARGPAVIAAEINRRLMPGYIQQLTKVTESNNKDATARAARLKVANRLAAIFADSRIDDDSKSSTEVNWYRDKQSLSLGYGDIRIGYNATDASFSAHSLPIELLEQVAQVIAEQS